jgi:Zn-finger domain-containing protein
MEVLLTIIVKVFVRLILRPDSRIGFSEFSRKLTTTSRVFIYLLAVKHCIPDFCTHPFYLNLELTRNALLIDIINEFLLRNLNIL